MLKKEIVWSETENHVKTSATLHGFYSIQRVDKENKPYWGNSALCNETFGISADGEVFLPIGLVPPAKKFDRKKACRACLAHFDKLAVTNDKTYIVKFNFSVAEKRSRFTAKAGEVEVTTEAPIEILKKDPALMKVIANEMQNKTKKVVMDIAIVSIEIKKAPKAKIVTISTKKAK